MSTQPNGMINVPNDSISHVDFGKRYMTDRASDHSLKCSSRKYPMKTYGSTMALDQKDQKIQSNKHHH